MSTGDTPAALIPAHQLQRGDRVNLHGTWHTTGRVTLENQLPEGATVHIVLDNGTSDADLDAHQPVQVERDGSAER